MVITTSSLLSACCILVREAAWNRNSLCCSAAHLSMSFWHGSDTCVRKCLLHALRTFGLPEAFVYSSERGDFLKL